MVDEPYELSSKYVKIKIVVHKAEFLNFFAKISKFEALWGLEEAPAANFLHIWRISDQFMKSYRPLVGAADTSRPEDRMNFAIL